MLLNVGRLIKRLEFRDVLSVSNILCDIFTEVKRTHCDDYIHKEILCVHFLNYSER